MLCQEVWRDNRRKKRSERIKVELEIKLQQANNEIENLKKRVLVLEIQCRTLANLVSEHLGVGQPVNNYPKENEKEKGTYAPVGFIPKTSSYTSVIQKGKTEKKKNIFPVVWTYSNMR